VKLNCSFCGGIDWPIVAGPAVYICFECITLCLDVLHESLPKLVEEQLDQLQVAIDAQRDRGIGRGRPGPNAGIERIPEPEPPRRTRAEELDRACPRCRAAPGRTCWDGVDPDRCVTTHPERTEPPRGDGGDR
jgi:hypothetical protein